jgi:hypothetical protein
VPKTKPDHYRQYLKWLFVFQNHASHKKMRYYIKCKLNPPQRQQLREGIESGSLAKGKIFYEGLQTASR